MILRRLITLPLAMFIIAGLFFAPLVTPASAKAFGSAKMSGMHSKSDMESTSDMDSMSADMPCCPDDKKNDACPDCPLMAICALKTAQAHPSMADALPMRSPVRTIHFAHDDAAVFGLDHPPPDHPPRSLI